MSEPPSSAGELAARPGATSTTTTTTTVRRAETPQQQESRSSLVASPATRHTEAEAVHALNDMLKHMDGFFKSDGAERRRRLEQLEERQMELQRMCEAALLDERSQHRSVAAEPRVRGQMRSVSPRYASTGHGLGEWRTTSPAEYHVDSRSSSAPQRGISARNAARPYEDDDRTGIVATPRSTRSYTSSLQGSGGEATCGPMGRHPASLYEERPLFQRSRLFHPPPPPPPPPRMAPLEDHRFMRSETDNVGRFTSTGVETPGTLEVPTPAAPVTWHAGGARARNPAPHAIDFSPLPQQPPVPRLSYPKLLAPPPSSPLKAKRAAPHRPVSPPPAMEETRCSTRAPPPPPSPGSPNDHHQPQQPSPRAAAADGAFGDSLVEAEPHNHVYAAAARLDLTAPTDTVTNAPAAPSAHPYEVAEDDAAVPNGARHQLVEFKVNSEAASHAGSTLLAKIGLHSRGRPRPSPADRGRPAATRTSRSLRPGAHQQGLYDPDNFDTDPLPGFGAREEAGGTRHRTSSGHTAHGDDLWPSSDDGESGEEAEAAITHSTDLRSRPKQRRVRGDVGWPGDAGRDTHRQRKQNVASQQQQQLQQQQLALGALQDENDDLHVALAAHKRQGAEQMRKIELLARHLVKALKERNILQEYCEQREAEHRVDLAELAELRERLQSHSTGVAAASGIAVTMAAKEREVRLCQEEVERLTALLLSRAAETDALRGGSGMGTPSPPSWTAAAAAATAPTPPLQPPPASHGDPRDAAALMDSLVRQLAEANEAVAVARRGQRESDERATRVTRELEQSVQYIQTLDLALSKLETRFSEAKLAQQFNVYFNPAAGAAGGGGREGCEFVWDVDRYFAAEAADGPRGDLGAGLSSHSLEAKKTIARLLASNESLSLRLAETARQYQLRLTNLQRENLDLHRLVQHRDSKVAALEDTKAAEESARQAERVRSWRWRRQLKDVQDDALLVSQVIQTSKEGAEDAAKVLATLQSLLDGRAPLPGAASDGGYDGGGGGGGGAAAVGGDVLDGLQKTRFFVRQVVRDFELLSRLLFALRSMALSLPDPPGGPAAAPDLPPVPPAAPPPPYPMPPLPALRSAPPPSPGAAATDASLGPDGCGLPSPATRLTFTPHTVDRAAQAPLGFVITHREGGAALPRAVPANGDPPRVPPSSDVERAVLLPLDASLTNDGLAPHTVRAGAPSRHVPKVLSPPLQPPPSLLTAPRVS